MGIMFKQFPLVITVSMPIITEWTSFLNRTNANKQSYALKSFQNYFQGQKSNKYV